MERINVLDRGYVHYVTHCGSDESIIEAARMSTDRGFKGWGTPDKPGDEKLLAYLFRNKHTSPFEMGDLTVEVKLPIMVTREWMRHRTQSYNEMSARYIVIPDEWYLPSVDRILQANEQTTNKQAMGNGKVLTRTHAELFRTQLDNRHKELADTYKRAVETGIQKELARGCTTVFWYTRMRAKANLLNWIKFLYLREAKDAQWEIRQYAHAVNRILTGLFPHTMRLYEESTQGR